MSDEHAVARGRIGEVGRRARRWAAALVAGSAIVSVLSSITRPLPSRLSLLLDFVPVELPQAASVALVFAALALILLSRGLRRGQRHAWLIAVVLLVLSAALNLAKGADVEEAGVALAVCGWLVWQQRHFAVHVNRSTVRRAVAIGFVAPLAAVTMAAVLVLTFGAHRHESVRESIAALTERLAGDRVLPLAIGSEIATPALVAVGIGVVIAMGWLMFSPQRHEPTARGTESDRARARVIVAQYGGGSL